MGLADYFGRQAQVAIFGDQIVSTRLDDISVQFQYNIASKDVTSIVTGSGVVEHDGVNMMRVQAGAGAAAGTAKATSVDCVRYRTGHDIYALFTCRWSAPIVGGKQYIGLFDGTDGVALGYNGLGFGSLFRSASVDTFTDDNNFSRTSLLPNSSGFILNPLYINLFRLNLGYLGIAPIIWEVYGGISKGWIPFHIMEFTNQQLSTHLTNPILPMRVEVESSGNGIVDIHTPSWNAGVTIDHQDEKADRFKTVRNSKTGITTETNIVTLKNQASFQGKANRIVTELTYISCSADGTKNVTIYLKKGATLGGSPSYSDLDAVNSVCQKDTAGTTITGGEIVFALELGKVDSRLIDLTNLHIRLQPGETLTASGTSASASDIAITLSEREMF